MVPALQYFFNQCRTKEAFTGLSCGRMARRLLLLQPAARLVQPWSEPPPLSSDWLVIPLRTNRTCRGRGAAAHDSTVARSGLSQRLPASAAFPRSMRLESRALPLFLRFMEYTLSLQVKHQLAVFPTHYYQGYSVELQVLGRSCLLFFLRSLLRGKALLVLNADDLWARTDSCCVLIVGCWTA